MPRVKAQGRRVAGTRARDRTTDPSRPCRAGDAPQFLALAGDWDVARMTERHPASVVGGAGQGLVVGFGRRHLAFAIEFGSMMIGSVGYFRRRSGAAELGFWLGRDHWGVGFGTEAAAAVVKYGLRAPGHSVFSSAHFVDNPASGRVLAKLGFMPTSRCAMWCSARGVEVDAIGLISRTRARRGNSRASGRSQSYNAPHEPGRLGRWFNTMQR